MERRGGESMRQEGRGPRGGAGASPGVGCSLAPASAVGCGGPIFGV